MSAPRKKRGAVLARCKTCGRTMPRQLCPTGIRLMAAITKKKWTVRHFALVELELSQTNVVYRWMAGSRKPEWPLRFKVLAKTGIEPEAWDT